MTVSKGTTRAAQLGLRMIPEMRFQGLGDAGLQPTAHHPQGSGPVGTCFVLVVLG